MQTKKIKTLKSVVSLYTYLFVVWGFYRLLFQFPGILEELVFKPLVWLIPLFVIMRRRKMKISDLGFSSRNLFNVFYFTIILGFLFSLAALIVNYLKYGQLEFGANLGQGAFLVSLLVSFVTAIVEEVPFRGYIYQQTQKVLSNEFRANVYTSLGWVLIHLPIAVFNWKLEPMSMMIYLVITFIFSTSSTYLFARTKNIATPILLHVFWQWPIILFR